MSAHSASSAIGAESLRRFETDVVVSTHQLYLGPAAHLEIYLAERVKGRVLVIEHQLVHSRPAFSAFRVYQDGKAIGGGEVRVNLGERARYVTDVWTTLSWCWRWLSRDSVFIGIDPLNCLAGLVLQMFGGCRLVVFYAIDFVPRRYKSRALNCAYHLVEHLVAFAASETWNVSDAMEGARWSGALWGRVVRRRRGTTRTVPIGLTLPKSPGARQAHRHPQRLAFMGHLLEKQGVQLGIGAMAKLTRDFPELQLLIVGDGPYRTELERLAHDLGVAERVTFHGYISDEQDMLDLLQSASIGLAPYLDQDDSFTRYADPGKLKAYLAAGLPSVVTRVPPTAQDLADAGCAVVVEATEEGVSAGLRSLLLEDDYTRLERRKRARGMAEGLVWTSVFDSALGSALTRLSE